MKASTLKATILILAYLDNYQIAKKKIMKLEKIKRIPSLFTLQFPLSQVISLQLCPMSEKYYVKTASKLVQSNAG